MLEQLFRLIQGEAQSEIITNPVIPDELNNHAVGLATDSIFNGLQNMLSNGGLRDVMMMFSSNSDTSINNPVVAGITNNFAGNLMNKFEIDNAMARRIATSVIPSILNKLVMKTNDPNDISFNINGIMGSLMGGNSSQGSPVQVPGLEEQHEQHSSGIDFNEILKSFNREKLEHHYDEPLGMDDLTVFIGKVTGGNQAQNQHPSGNGIMDLLKGLMH